MNEKFPRHNQDGEPDPTPDEELDPIELMLCEDDEELNKIQEELLKNPPWKGPWDDSRIRILTIAELRQIQDPSSDPSTYDPTDFLLSAEGMYSPLELLMPDLLTPPDSDETDPEPEEGPASK